MNDKGGSRAGGEPAPASFEQERAWLEDRLAPGHDSVTGAVIRLCGPLNHAALGAAIGGLATRHPSLRTGFRLAGDALVQVPGPAPELALDAADGSGAGALELAARALREPFDLGRGPLLRARLIRAGPAEHLLALAAHRAVADEPSLAVLLAELGPLYAAGARGAPPGDGLAPPPAYSPAEYGTAQRRRLADGGFEAALRYWRGQLEGVTAAGFPALRAGADEGPGGRGSARRRAATGTLAGLRRFAAGRRARASDVLMAGCHALLARYTTDPDAIVGAAVCSLREPGMCSASPAPALRAHPRSASPAPALGAHPRSASPAPALGAHPHSASPAPALGVQPRSASPAPALSLSRPLASRPPPLYAHARSVVGQFTDIVVVRAALSGDPTFAELTDGAAAAMAAARRHGDAPFGAVLAALRPPREPDRYPFFGVGADFAACCDEPAAVPVAPALPGLEAELVEVTSAGLAAGLCLGALVAPDGELVLTAGYPAHRYSAKWAEGLLAHWEAALSAGLADPALPVSALPLLSERERREAVAAARGPRRGYPSQPVHLLVARQAAETPGAVAVTCAGRQLSYAGLAGAAGAAAGRLSSLGAGPGSLVGLFLDRDIELVVAILGVLGAGAGFLPLDTTHPPGRLAMICEDAGAEIVLTTEALAPKLPAGVRPVTGWRDVAGAGSGAAGGSGAGGGTGPGDLDALCHVVFTSGSTGRPKGVAASHRNVTAFLSGLLHTVGADRFRRTLFSTALSFDACLVELWPPLITGGTLVICDGLLDAAAGPGVLEGVTLANAVPSVLAEFLRASAFPASLRTLMVGAEPLPGALVREVFERSQAEEVYNMYGPTETTSYATMRRMPRQPGEPTVTIGRPIDNVVALVLDRYGNPAPAGAPGELFLGGPGVAIGYRNEPRLTGERFVTVTVDGAGQRMYRTGDACRRRADGELEFLGRLDDQVKVRGFRIELGEIQAALARHPAVRATVAAVREDPAGQRRLVGYYVTDGAAPSAAELAATCRQTLPASLVPEAFVRLAAIPRTATGKANRRALPDPPWGGAPAPAEPGTGVAGEVARAWCALLGRAEVAWQDNFFDLGGSSLVALMMVQQAGQRLGVALPPGLAWSAPTFAALTREVEKAATPGTAAPGTAAPGPAAPGPAAPGTGTAKPGDGPARPADGGLAPGAGSLAPRTGTERVIAAVYADVLGVPRVGALDDFFDLGGSSVKAAVVIGRIRHQLGVTVPMADFMVAATVEGIAQLVEETLLSRVSAEELAAAVSGARPDLTTTTEAPDHG